MACRLSHQKNMIALMLTAILLVILLLVPGKFFQTPGKLIVGIFWLIMFVVAVTWTLQPKNEKQSPEQIIATPTPTRIGATPTLI